MPKAKRNNCGEDQLLMSILTGKGCGICMRLSPELDEGWVGSRRRGRRFDVKTEMFPVSIKCQHFQEANIGNKPELGVNIPQIQSLLCF